jgi:hypothetical protein
LFSHRKLSLTAVLGAHAASTVERMRAQRVVLAVQDTTTLNYSTQLATEGLGPIGSRKDRGQGLVLHEQKESRKWRLSFEAAVNAQRELPDTVVVSVGDREADVYDSPRIRGKGEEMFWLFAPLSVSERGRGRGRVRVRG